MDPNELKGYMQKFVHNQDKPMCGANSPATSGLEMSSAMDCCNLLSTNFKCSMTEDLIDAACSESTSLR